MQTASVSLPPIQTCFSNSNQSQSPASTASIQSPAFESTVASYASKLLKLNSPSTAVIDPSVGPYVTSILRSALAKDNISPQQLSSLFSNPSASFDIQSVVPEYDALMELLMEQCELSLHDARSALQRIARALQTGEFEDAKTGRGIGMGIGIGIGLGLGAPAFLSRSRNNSFGVGMGLGMGMGGMSMSMSGRFRSKSMGAEHDFVNEDSIRLLGDMLKGNGKINDATGAPGVTGAPLHAGISPSPSPSPSFSRPRSMTMTETSFTTLPSWNFGKQRRSSIDIGGLGGTIEEESSLGTDHSFDIRSPTPEPREAGFIMNGFSPFLTQDEKDVVDKLRNMPPPTFSFTPLKPDRLIPVDLLGVIDDPSNTNTIPGDLTKRFEQDVYNKDIHMDIHLDKDKSEHDNVHVDTKNGPLLNVNVNSNKQESTVSAETSSKESSKVEQISESPLPHEASLSLSNKSKAKSQLKYNASVRSNSLSLPSSSPMPQAKLYGPTTGKGKKKAKIKANDLAAALFTRPRSRSVHGVSYDEKSPKLRPMAPPASQVLEMSDLNNCSASAVLNNSLPALFQKQLDSAVEILMAMNYDLCRDAAHDAGLVSNANVNVAQHVIDGALHAPPVCRHMLNGGCYRSDCHFSHDVDGHTCLFWLRGRCGKKDTCRFMHGFSEKLLEGVNIDARNVNGNGNGKSNNYACTSATTTPTSAHGNEEMQAPVTVKTTNLVQHNMITSFTKPRSASAVYSAPNEQQKSLKTAKSSDSQYNKSRNDPTPMEAQIEKNKSSNTFSFASIASKGYSQQSSFHKNKSISAPTSSSSSSVSTGQNGMGKASSNEANKPPKTVRIPPNLWNASHNRSSVAFHIVDPLARYKEVSNSVQRDDVIDLHFQSIRTFPVVLATVLPEKLKDHGEVWVVTGSGHHVNRSSHQKTGGVLETAVSGWLSSNKYVFVKGKDKNGFGGAVLVQSSR